MPAPVLVLSPITIPSTPRTSSPSSSTHVHDSNAPHHHTHTHARSGLPAQPYGNNKLYSSTSEVTLQTKTTQRQPSSSEKKRSTKTNHRASTSKSANRNHRDHRIFSPHFPTHPKTFEATASLLLFQRSGLLARKRGGCRGSLRSLSVAQTQSARGGTGNIGVATVILNNNVGVTDNSGDGDNNKTVRNARPQTAPLSRRMRTAASDAQTPATVLVKPTMSPTAYPTITPVTSSPLLSPSPSPSPSPAPLLSSLQQKLQLQLQPRTKPNNVDIGMSIDYNPNLDPCVYRATPSTSMTTHANSFTYLMRELDFWMDFDRNVSVDDNCYNVGDYDSQSQMRRRGSGNNGEDEGKTDKSRYNMKAVHVSNWSIMQSWRRGIFRQRIRKVRAPEGFGGGVGRERREGGSGSERGDYSRYGYGYGSGLNADADAINAPNPSNNTTTNNNVNHDFFNPQYVQPFDLALTLHKKISDPSHHLTNIKHRQLSTYMTAIFSRPGLPLSSSSAAAAAASSSFPTAATSNWLTTYTSDENDYTSLSLRASLKLSEARHLCGLGCFPMHVIAALSVEHLKGEFQRLERGVVCWGRGRGGERVRDVVEVVLRAVFVVTDDADNDSKDSTSPNGHDNDHWHVQLTQLTLPELYKLPTFYDQANHYYNLLKHELSLLPSTKAKLQAFKAERAMELKALSKACDEWHRPIAKLCFYRWNGVLGRERDYKRFARFFRHTNAVAKLELGVFNAWKTYTASCSLSKVRAEHAVVKDGAEGMKVQFDDCARHIDELIVATNSLQAANIKKARLLAELQVTANDPARNSGVLGGIMAALARGVVRCGEVVRERVVESVEDVFVDGVENTRLSNVYRHTGSSSSSPLASASSLLYGKVKFDSEDAYSPSIESSILTWRPGLLPSCEESHCFTPLHTRSGRVLRRFFNFAVAAFNDRFKVEARGDLGNVARAILSSPILSPKQKASGSGNSNSSARGAAAGARGVAKPASHSVMSSMPTAGKLQSSSAAAKEDKAAKKEAAKLKRSLSPMVGPRPSPRLPASSPRSLRRAGSWRSSSLLASPRSSLTSPRTPLERERDGELLGERSFASRFKGAFVHLSDLRSCVDYISLIYYFSKLSYGRSGPEVSEEQFSRTARKLALSEVSHAQSSPMAKMAHMHKEVMIAEVVKDHCRTHLGDLGRYADACHLTGLKLPKTEALLAKEAELRKVKKGREAKSGIIVQTMSQYMGQHIRIADTSEQRTFAFIAELCMLNFRYIGVGVEGEEGEARELQKRLEKQLKAIGNAARDVIKGQGQEKEKGAIDTYHTGTHTGKHTSLSSEHLLKIGADLRASLTSLKPAASACSALLLHCYKDRKSYPQFTANLMHVCWQSLCTTILAVKVRIEEDLDDGTFTTVRKAQLDSYFKQLGVLDEAEKDAMCLGFKEILRTRIRDVRRIFSFYAASSDTGHVGELDVSEVWKFTKDCQLQKDRKALPSVRVDLLIQSCTIDFSKQGLERVSSASPELGPTQFVEFMVKAASHRYAKGTWLERFQKLLNEDVLPNACSINVDVFRERISGDKCRAVTKKHEANIEAVFEDYAKDDSKAPGGADDALANLQAMSIDDLVACARDFKLVGPLLSERAVRVLFAYVQNNNPNEETESSDGDELIFSEFLESLFAIGAQNYPDPYNVLNIRLDRFLTLDIMTEAFKMHRFRANRSMKKLKTPTVYGEAEDFEQPPLFKRPSIDRDMLNFGAGALKRTGSSSSLDSMSPGGGNNTNKGMSPGGNKGGNRSRNSSFGDAIDEAAPGSPKTTAAQAKRRASSSSAMRKSFSGGDNLPVKRKSRRNLGSSSATGIGEVADGGESEATVNWDKIKEMVRMKKKENGGGGEVQEGKDADADTDAGLRLNSPDVKVRELE